MTAKIDWVTRRSRCSAAQMFETLRLEVSNDIDTRNSLGPADRSYTFRMADAGNRFTVIREGSFMHGVSINADVAFSLANDEITVRAGDRTITATVTLDDDGECRFKVKGRDKECDSWHLRKLALEEIFFVGI